MRKRIKFKFQLDGHCTETDTAYEFGRKTLNVARNKAEHRS